MKFRCGSLHLLLVTFLLSLPAILARPSSLEHDPVTVSEEDILGVSDETTTRDFDHSTAMRAHEGSRRKLPSSSRPSSEEGSGVFTFEDIISHAFDPVIPPAPQDYKADLNGACDPFCTFHWRKGTCICSPRPKAVAVVLFRTTTSIPAVSNEDDN